MTRARCRGAVFKRAQELIYYFFFFERVANQRFAGDADKMLCHVTRPDSVVMEVEVDAKANGEDCLNKVGCGGIHITFCYYGSFFFFKKRSGMVRQGSSALLLFFLCSTFNCPFT